MISMCLMVYSIYSLSLVSYLLSSFTYCNFEFPLNPPFVVIFGVPTEQFVINDSRIPELAVLDYIDFINISHNFSIY